jgi:hypothetical protein
MGFPFITSLILVLDGLSDRGQDIPFYELDMLYSLFSHVSGLFVALTSLLRGIGDRLGVMYPSCMLIEDVGRKVQKV